jgi:hypothetical protein
MLDILPYCFQFTLDLMRDAVVSMVVNHITSLKVTVQGLDFMAHPYTYIHQGWWTYIFFRVSIKNFKVSLYLIWSSADIYNVIRIQNLSLLFEYKVVNSVSIITRRLKTRWDRARGTSSVANMPQINNDERNIGIMNQPLSRTFKETF